MQVEDLEVANSEVIISGRYMNDFVGADAFMRSCDQHLHAHDTQQGGTNQPDAAFARPPQRSRKHARLLLIQ